MNQQNQDIEKLFLGKVLYKLLTRDNFNDLEDEKKNAYCEVALKFSTIIIKRLEYNQLKKDMDFLNEFIDK